MKFQDRKWREIKVHISKLYLIISNNCWLWSFNTENEEKLRCIQEKKTWLIGLFRREDATSYTGLKVCAPLINPIFTSQGRNQPLAYMSVTWPSLVGIGLRCLCRPVWKIQILAVLNLFSISLCYPVNFRFFETPLSVTIYFFEV